MRYPFNIDQWSAIYVSYIYGRHLEFYRSGDWDALRGDFLKNRVFLAKSAQNLVTKPAGENPLTAIIFSNKFSKICENLKNFTGSLAT